MMIVVEKSASFVWTKDHNTYIMAVDIVFCVKIVKTYRLLRETA